MSIGGATKRYLWRLANKSSRRMERRVSGITLEILGRLRLLLQKWLLHYNFFWFFGWGTPWSSLSTQTDPWTPCFPVCHANMQTRRKQHRTRGLNVHDVGVDLAKPSKPTKHFVPLALIGKQQNVTQTGVRTFRIWSANNAVIVKVSNVVSLLICTERFYLNTQKDFSLGRGYLEICENLRRNNQSLQKYTHWSTDTSVKKKYNFFT